MTTRITGSVKRTPEELEEYDCLNNPGMECCARAFVCCVCKQRLVGTAESPEY